MRLRTARFAWIARRDAALVIARCRKLQRIEPPGPGRARIAQLVEYAELVAATPHRLGELPPMFAGKVCDD